jgi:hypothetical protein
MERSGTPGDVVFRMISQSFSSSALMSREKMHFYGAHPWCGKKRMLSLLRIERKTKDASAHGLLLCGGSCSSKNNCEKDTHR